MKRGLLVVILLIRFCSAQEIVEGVLLDNSSKKPVQYANVFLLSKGVGAVTNAEGEFRMVLPQKYKNNDSVQFSSIGYASKLHSIGELKSVDTIYIDPQIINLEEVVILHSDLNAKDVVRIALGKIPKNHSAKPYLLKAFYRHYCSENDVYGRLIEAAVDLYDTKGHKKLYNKPENKTEVRVNQLRKSYDYTRNFDEHDPISIYSTLKYDITSYQTMLHNYPDEWNFTIVDTTFYNGSMVWVINYTYRFLENKKGNVLYVESKGEMYISMNDFAFLKIGETRKNELNKEFEKHSYYLEWEVQYHRYNGKYYMAYCKETGWNIDVKLDNNKNEVSAKDHRFHVEMMVNSIVNKGFEKFKGVEPTAEDLKQIEYDPLFWKSYTVIKDSPLDEKIIADLEKEKELKEQFGE